MKYRTAEEAFGFLESFANFEKSRKQTIRDYRLDRMEKLLEHFGNPHKNLKLIHIAGSKGKGSTGILAASALKGLGIKTGLYTSPHVGTYRERISLGGSFFDDAVYIKAVEDIEEGLKGFRLSDDTGSGEPTTFELLTLMAFMIFSREGCSWAVIETGIGGRLDATNVIIPEAVIITPVEMEHADILGDSIEKIAGEKAGIIKKGVPVFSAPQRPEVMKILREKASGSGSKFHTTDEWFEKITSGNSLEGNSVVLQPKSGKTVNMKLQLRGKIQAENAALAYCCISALRKYGVLDHDPAGISFESAVCTGMGNAVLPGRFEVIEKSSTQFILDGAHTAGSVSKLATTYLEIFGNGGVMIFGSVTGKDPAGMARILADLFDVIIISTPGTFKESNPESVFETFRKLKSRVFLEKDPAKALETAIKYAEELSDTEKTVPVLATGSFYMAGEIRNLLIQRNKKRSPQ